MPLVAITRLRLRSVIFELPFIWHAVPSGSQAKRADGCMNTVLRRAAGAYWTMTMWRDAAAMRAYMTSGAHLKAMPKLIKWCDEAAVAHWQQDSTELPSWKEGEHRLAAEGRLSKVAHPSPAHLAGYILGSSK
jgi:heme-degrading monooxygenase HmoA